MRYVRFDVHINKDISITFHAQKLYARIGAAHIRRLGPRESNHMGQKEPSMGFKF